MFLAMLLFGLGKQSYGEITLSNKVPLMKTLLCERLCELDRSIKSLEAEQTDTNWRKALEPKDISTRLVKIENKISSIKYVISLTHKEILDLDQAIRTPI
jgi:phage terminase large subunit-like protein